MWQERELGLSLLLPGHGSGLCYGQISDQDIQPAIRVLEDQQFQIWNFKMRHKIYFPMLAPKSYLAVLYVILGISACTLLVAIVIGVGAYLGLDNDRA